MLRYLTSVLILITIFTLHGQNQQWQGFEGRISGKVLDSLSRTPMEYVNLVLINKRDSSIAGGTITRVTGEFALEKLSAGRYDLSISFIGYKTKVFKDLMLTPKNPEILIGEVSLLSESVNLDEVVVSGERELYTNHLDKKVIHVDKDLTSAGGNATDVLQNIPSVQVDADGTVSYRGNSNLTILIDGRPAGMSGVSASDILAQIPVSNIESIELVTNPSAKYNPEGTAGIINIKLKKKGNSGFNGVASLNAGTGDKYNTSLNLNLKEGDFNFFGNYDTRFNRFSATSLTNRTNFIGSSVSYFDQNSTGVNRFSNHNIGAGLDYYLTDKATLTFAYQYRTFSPVFRNTLSNANYNGSRDLTRAYIRSSDADRNISSNNFTFTHRQLFEKKDRELVTDLMFSTTTMDRDEDIYSVDTDLSSNTPAAPVQTRGTSGNSNDQWVLQSNYVEPLGEKTKLEAGFRSQYKDLASNNDSYIFSGGTWNADATQQNYFDYTEQLHAIYATFTSEIGSFKYLAGLRGEQLIGLGNLTSQGVKFENSYFSLYPSMHVGYKLAENNDLLLSYSRRVDRPNNRQLNPFVDVADSMNIVAGNPYLDAQYTDAYEFEYQTSFAMTSITSTLFYKKTHDIISIVSTLQSNGAIYNTYENIASGTNYGTELVFMQPLAKWWRMQAAFSYFNAAIEGGTVQNPISNKGESWTARINSNFVISPDFSLQVVGMYNSPSISFSMGWGGNQVLAQGKVKEMYGIDLAGKKDFLDGKLSLTARVSDIFNTRKFSSEGTGAGFLMNSERKFDSRVVYLGISYKLDTKFRERRIKTSGDAEDL